MCECKENGEGHFFCLCLPLLMACGFHIADIFLGLACPVPFGNAHISTRGVAEPEDLFQFTAWKNNGDSLLLGLREGGQMKLPS